MTHHTLPVATHRFRNAGSLVTSLALAAVLTVTACRSTKLPEPATPPAPSEAELAPSSSVLQPGYVPPPRQPSASGTDHAHHHHAAPSESEPALPKDTEQSDHHNHQPAQETTQ